MTITMIKAMITSATTTPISTPTAGEKTKLEEPPEIPFSSSSSVDGARTPISVVTSP